MAVKKKTPLHKQKAFKGQKISKKARVAGQPYGSPNMKSC